MSKMSIPNYMEEDIKAEGYLALVEAANRYDAEKGYAFTTYAVKCISGKIRTYLKANESSIHYSMYSLEVRNKIKKELNELGIESIHECPKYILDDLGINEYTFKQVISADRTDTSLNSEVDGKKDDTVELLDLVADKNSKGYFDRGIDSELDIIDNYAEYYMIRHKRYNYKYMQIWVEYAYGLVTGDVKRQVDMAKKYDVSRQLINTIILRHSEDFKKYIRKYES